LRNIYKILFKNPAEHRPPGKNQHVMCSFLAALSIHYSL